MSSRSDRATEKFASGYNCAQSVFSSFCDELGLEQDAALRLACGFGAGVARRQEVCGALSGGVLAIGSRHGRGEGQDRAATEATYEKVRELMSRFEAAHGSCRCRDLLNGCDLSTPEGRQSFQEQDLLHSICIPCVRTIVEALEEIL